MKRTTKCLLALTLVLALLLPSFAQAAATDVYVINAGSCLPGRQYALFLVKKGADAKALREEDLLFIDQLNADQNGRIAAVAVISAPADCDVYLGGEFTSGIASPRKVAPSSAVNTPKSLTDISADSFSNTMFTYIHLGPQTRAIRERAFVNCSVLTYVYIPATVEIIEDNAFVNCPNLVIGCEADSIAELYALNNGIPCRVAGS